MVRSRGIIGALFALLITFLVFLPFFTMGHIPVPGPYMASWYEPWKTDTTVNGVPQLPHKPIGDDVFRQVIPFKRLAIQEMTQGRWPLWNPYGGAGQPLLATIHSAYLNPFSYLLLLGGKDAGWAWYVLAQMMLTGVMFFWLMSLIGLTTGGALVATASLLLSGFMVIRLEYGVYGYAMASLAALGCGAELLRARRAFGLVITSLATWFLLFTVQPQIFTYVLVFAVLYGAVRLWGRPRDVVVYGAGIAIGIGLSAPQILPMFELYRASNVTTDASRFIFDRFLLPAAHIITLGIPNYFGNAATYNWWGRGDFVQTMLTMGLIPVFLGAYAVFRRKRDPLVTLLAGTIGITVFLTIDSPFTRWFYTLPLPIISTNIPSRMFIVTTFAASILAGIGFMRFVRERSKLGSLVLFSAIPAFLGIATFLLWRTGAPCPVEVPTCRVSALRNTLLEIAVFLAFAASAHAFRRHGRIFVTLSLLILVGVGLYNAQKILPFSESRYVMPEHALLTFLRSRAPERVVGIGTAAFATDFSAEYRYMDANYYDPLYIRRYGELVSYANTGDSIRGLSRSDVSVVSDATPSAETAFRREQFWDAAGVSALVVRQGEYNPCRPANPFKSRNCPVLWEDANWQVVARETALPRAYVVSTIVPVSDNRMLLSRMFDPATDLSGTAFVEVPIHGIQGTGSAKGYAAITSYETDRVTVEVEAAHAALLVLSDTYFPGWHATVDGTERTVYRTNYAFRGVVVPQGRHTVVFRYEPASFRAGLIIGAGFLCLLMLYSVIQIRNRPN